MQCHLDSGVARLQRLGMVVGECLSSLMDLNGTKLAFEVTANCRLGADKANARLMILIKIIEYEQGCEHGADEGDVC